MVLEMVIEVNFFFISNKCEELVENEKVNRFIEFYKILITCIYSLKYLGIQCVLVCMLMVVYGSYNLVDVNEYRC